LDLAQVGEAAADVLGDTGTAHLAGEQPEQLVVAAEVGEVEECQIQGVVQCPGRAPFAHFVELSLSAGHTGTVGDAADAGLFWL
jgi:hypothetical protein